MSAETTIRPVRNLKPPARLPGLSGPASTRRWQQGYSRRLLVTDLLVVGFALWFSHLLRFGSGLWPEFSVRSSAGSGGGLSGVLNDHWVVSSAVLVMWMLALDLLGSRDWKVYGNGAREYRRVLHATFTVFGMLAILAFAFQWGISRGYLILAMPLGLLGLLLTRWFWRRVLHRHRREGTWSHRAVIVGEESKARHAQNQISREAQRTGLAVAAVIIQRPTRCEEEEITDAEEAVEQVLDAVTRTAADMLILTSADTLNPRALRELGWELAKLDVDVVVTPSLTDVAGPRIHARPVAGLPLIHVDYPRLSGRAALMKRIFDVGFSLMVLTVLAPLLLVTAVAVKWDSSGPVLFRQQRIGLRHSRFHMVKFRSMVVDAEAQKKELQARSEGNGVLFKMRSDPRVTRVGRVLRRYSLDELPQFLNVLRGEMSVVGPRPPLASEVTDYEDSTHRRLLVKPGITGLWQVQGRSDLSWEDSVRLDLYYVENWSMTTDIGIVLRTVRAVSSGAGAY